MKKLCTEQQLQAIGPKSNCFTSRNISLQTMSSPTCECKHPSVRPRSHTYMAGNREVIAVEDSRSPSAAKKLNLFDRYITTMTKFSGEKSFYRRELFDREIGPRVPCPLARRVQRQSRIASNAFATIRDLTSHDTAASRFTELGTPRGCYRRKHESVLVVKLLRSQAQISNNLIPYRTTSQRGTIMLVRGRHKRLYGNLGFLAEARCPSVQWQQLIQSCNDQTFSRLPPA